MINNLLTLVEMRFVMLNFVNQKKMIMRIFFLESMELDELETSYSSTEMYCTELNIHNTCVQDMRSEEKSCEKIERKETLSGKSRLDDTLLMRENTYEVKLERSQVGKENEK
ncbi:hypothetical protein J1N35_029458 [Gossypium stocksii]|uniref:Uncharacterized protein n=1 Tax=Gossypium stocksii TaxID=47602 RepID=A0A9D3UY04_9ROSI|nr:hypothetical protein J1N35_029458 [Gossypium stocksii]